MNYSRMHLPAIDMPFTLPSACFAFRRYGRKLTWKRRFSQQSLCFLVDVFTSRHRSHGRSFKHWIPSRASPRFDSKTNLCDRVWSIDRKWSQFPANRKVRVPLLEMTQILGGVEGAHYFVIWITTVYGTCNNCKRLRDTVSKRIVCIQILFSYAIREKNFPLIWWFFLGVATTGPQNGKFGLC